jgi:hypothetical protein
MKKGEAVRRIKPEKHIEDNLMIAQYGVFADTKAFQAWEQFHMGLVASEHTNTTKMEQMTGQPFTKLVLLWGLEPIIAALKRRDAYFFEKLAELFRWLESQKGGPASPKWAYCAAYIARERKRILYGDRTTEITRKEVQDYLKEHFSDEVNENFMSQMEKQLGVKLKHGKPGPKPERRQKSGGKRR